MQSVIFIYWDILSLVHFSAYKSGHFLNNRLLATLKQDQCAWELIESHDLESVPTTIIRPLAAETYG